VGPSTRAIVVTHAAEEPRKLEHLIPTLEGSGVDIIEDCAQVRWLAEGQTPAGPRGRFACYSFGRGKAIDAGEGGLLAVRDAKDLDDAARRSQHLARLQLLGISPAVANGCLNHRIHPIAAIVALWRMSASGGRRDGE
jgi:dTDP-4-amino-4,6-dideoxygalactose transaminase